MIEIMKAHGFILQASYRVVSASHGRRMPVVHLYGRLVDGGTFLVRDDRQRPHFYVRVPHSRTRARAARSAMKALANSRKCATIRFFRKNRNIQ
jgi:hypothetical protein